LTFEDIKEPNWETCFSRIKKLIQVEYLKHNYLLDSITLRHMKQNILSKL
jgi:hypothetical protein